MRALAAAESVTVDEAKAAFHLRLRARGVRDLRVLRAFELVPRVAFAPDGYLDAASRDLAIPIGNGQTLQPAWLAARMVEALDVRAEHRVLEVGSGSGHTTAVLAHLAAEVLGVERFRGLAQAAQARLAGLAITTAVIKWGDGLELTPDVVGTFDRILVHGSLEAPEAFGSLMRSRGVLVCARPKDQGEAVVRLSESDGLLTETRVCSAHLPAMRTGLRAGG